MQNRETIGEILTRWQAIGIDAFVSEFVAIPFEEAHRFILTARARMSTQLAGRSRFGE
jgi:hypothetical protein